MQAQAEKGPVRPGPAPLVVVADDDAAILELVQLVLEGEGYRTLGVRDGAAALEAIARERPALLLLDMRMPGQSGWEVAATLRREDPSGSSVPVVVMSATTSTALWAAEIGARAHLEKPFDLAELVAVVGAVARPGP